ncbi:MAG: choice-of-anchor Q domain-containing protein [bacterium]|nr:choice-of-anchor Q domain-containing protein [bacterium]
MKKTVVLFAFGLLTSVRMPTPATSWYVDGSIPASGDGLSSESAFKTIQEAVDSASDADTIVVERWTYYENVHFKGKNIRLLSTNPLDPDVVAGTIIDGFRNGSVVSFAGTENESCLLSGFTIRQGRAQEGAGIYGGPYESRSRATISHNVITRNSALLNGGGVSYCSGALSDNVVMNNSAGEKGGGLYQCDGIIRNCKVEHNSAWKGGGISSSDDVIENCSFSANSALSEGGGLYDCDATLLNCTVYGNSAGTGGGGLAYCEGVIRNCIVWGNKASFGTQLHGSSFPSYCCIERWDRGGEGNFPDDPLLLDPADGDYHLQGTSPCIDAAADGHWYRWPQRDLDRHCRLIGEHVDIGCYERGSSFDTDGDLLSDAHEIAVGTDPGEEDTDGDGLRDGLERVRGTDPLVRDAPRRVSVPADCPTIQEAILFAFRNDEIVISPGAYEENIHFCGVDIIVRSVFPDAPQSVRDTILDGGNFRPVICFMGNETETCQLFGLTLRNGRFFSGGGIVGRGTLATIQNNWIVANEGWAGAGLARCDGRIMNNLIAGNAAWNRGGGLYRCNGDIVNNTVTENTAPQEGGGLHECAGQIHNCILWGNAAPAGEQVFDSILPEFSCVQNWTEGGAGNITADPRFVNPYGPDMNFTTYEDNNYRLLPDSPCIDTGKNDDWMWEAVDLDGNSRIFEGIHSLTVDTGAYEYPSIRPVSLTISSDYGPPDPPSGTYTYAKGEMVPAGTAPSLVYEDNVGIRYRCIGYTGTGSAPSGVANSYPAFVITEDSVLHWNWGTQFRVVSSAGPEGTISPEGESWYDAGEEATFIAVPSDADEYRIDRWLVDGTEVFPDRNSLTLTDLDGPHEVEVIFERIPSVIVRSNIEAPYSIRRLPDGLPLSGTTQPTSDPKVFEAIHRDAELGDWEITWLPREDAWPRRSSTSAGSPVTDEMTLSQGEVIEFSKNYIVRMPADFCLLEKRIDYASGIFVVRLSVTNVTGPDNPPARTFLSPIWLVVKDIVFGIPGPHSEARLMNPDGVTSTEYPDSGEFLYVDASDWAPLPPRETSSATTLEFYIKDRNPTFEPIIEIWAYDPVTDLDLDGYEDSVDPDADGDEIPDVWEVAYGLPTDRKNGEADADGDGYSDFEEYVAATDPTVADSHFCVSHLIPVEGGGLLLGWQTVSSRVYVVEVSDSPGGPWTPWSGETIPGHGSMEWRDVRCDRAKSRFYRIRVSFP